MKYSWGRELIEVFQKLMVIPDLIHMEVPVLGLAPHQHVKDTKNPVRSCVEAMQSIVFMLLILMIELEIKRQARGYIRKMI